MGVLLSLRQILQVLASANELARLDGDALNEDISVHLEEIRKAVGRLQQQDVPKTYLAVSAVFLTARALHERDTLDVLAIQAEASPSGYSASSIGGALASFAKEQGIDLRAKSSQPLNNQPFTFKERLTRDTKVAKRFRGAWNEFMDFADVIQDMTSQEAQEGLALLFYLARRAEVPLHAVVMREGVALAEVTKALTRFVSTHSDNGAVGQAFAAALLDLTYGAASVALGSTQDPDASVPGDVQVAQGDDIWLWTEVKQKVIQTGDIAGFLEKVHHVGGTRAIYFALSNDGYSGYINRDTLDRSAPELGVSLRLFESPAEALSFFLEIAPGSEEALTHCLLTRFRTRLLESGCSPESLSAFDALTLEPV